jgi:hypothetical protein
MDESALQDRLDRLERRLTIVLALLVVPYLVAVGELLGYWTAGVLFTGLGVVAMVIVAIQRRRVRNATEQ